MNRRNFFKKIVYLSSAFIALRLSANEKKARSEITWIFKKSDL